MPVTPSRLVSNPMSARASRGPHRPPQAQAPSTVLVLFIATMTVRPQAAAWLPFVPTRASAGDRMSDHGGPQGGSSNAKVARGARPASYEYFPLQARRALEKPNPPNKELPI